MKRAAIITTIILAMFGIMNPAGAQNYDESNRPVRNNREMLAGAVDIPQGSLCQISDINNASIYPPNEFLEDRGNMLLVMRGRGGEHDTDWLSAPAERVEGVEMFPDFVTTGDGFGGPGDIAVFILFDRHHSIDDLTVSCTPPPEPPTTTTTTPPATTEPPTTTTVAPPPSSTPPPPELAITGTSTTGILAGTGAAFVLVGVVARMASDD